MNHGRSDLQVGKRHPPRVDLPLSVTDFVRYQGASGDMSPHHHDLGFAQAAGLRDILAIGMLQAGVLATYCTDWLGAENVRRFKVEFREQAWPGDVITYSARIEASRSEDGVELVDLALLAVRQTGGVHIKGEATFAVPVSGRG